jgi:uncharacterized protein with HEPN domain
LKDKTVDDFKSDILSRLAIERALEIICEASHRIPENIQARQKAIDWQRMVDFGNLLRHAYHRIDPQIVYEIAVRDLPPLKAFAERIVREAE